MKRQRATPTAPASWSRVIAGVAVGIGIGGSLVGGGLWLSQRQTQAVHETNPPMRDNNPHKIDRTSLPNHPSPRLEELQAAVERRPDALDLRSDLAFTLLANELYVPAFEQAKEIQKLEPEHPDALSIEGMVRLRMGQNSGAAELFDRVLGTHPDHVRALEGRGLAALRFGRPSAAIEFWERGLRAAGGSHEELERLLAASRTAGQVPERSAARSTASRTDSTSEPRHDGDRELINSYLRPPKVGD